MIPRTIHYFWFGRGEKSQLEQDCIARFEVFAPGAVIKEWNEDNFDVEAHPYTRQAYADRKWAFVSDYARMKVLYEEGGIYLDTDMWLVRDISELFSEGTFLGKEDETFINAAICGAIPGDIFLYDVLQKYNELSTRITIPRILTDIYVQKKYNITIYKKEFFYPFTQDTIHLFNKINQPAESFAVHMWNYSWGHPIVKFLKRKGIYKNVLAITNKIGIKNFFKKIAQLE